MKRIPRIGDTVTIHATLCEWDRVTGQIVGISDSPGNDMAYMMQRPNYDVWPFALCELELHSLDLDEEYGEP